MIYFRLGLAEQNIGETRDGVIRVAQVSQGMVVVVYRLAQVSVGLP